MTILKTLATELNTTAFNYLIAIHVMYYKKIDPDDYKVLKIALRNIIQITGKLKTTEACQQSTEGEANPGKKL